MRGMQELRFGQPFDDGHCRQLVGGNLEKA
jgi:hypothetical protein